MMNHMSSLVDEVRQIEGKVLAISKLQETFTENVLRQVSLVYLVYYCIFQYNFVHCCTYAVYFSKLLYIPVYFCKL